MNLEKNNHKDDTETVTNFFDFGALLFCITIIGLSSAFILSFKQCKKNTNSNYNKTENSYCHCCCNTNYNQTYYYNHFKR